MKKISRNYQIFGRKHTFALGKLSRIKWLVIGVAFVLLGIVGLFLPFLQGILFIVIGVLCLAKGSVTIRSQKIRFKKRFPKIGAKLAFLEKMARDWRKKRSATRGGKK